MFTSGLRRPQFLKSKMRALPRLAQHEWKFHSVPTPWRNVVSLSDCTTHEMVELHMCHRRNFDLGLPTTKILGLEAGFQIHQPKLFSLLTAALSIDPSWKDPRKVVFCRWSFRYSLSARGTSTFFSLSHSQNNASISQSGIQSLVWVWVFKGNLHWHNVMSNKVSKHCSKFIFWRDVKEKNSVRHILFITQGKSWINLSPNVDHASSNFQMKGIVCIVGCTVLQPLVVLDSISFQWRLCFIQFCSRAAKPLCTVSTSSDVLLFCSTRHFYDWGQNKRENIEACLTKSITITAS